MASEVGEAKEAKWTPSAVSLQMTVAPYSSPASMVSRIQRQVFPKPG